VRNSATASSTVSFCKGTFLLHLLLGGDAARAVAHAPSAPRETRGGATGRGCLLDNRGASYGPRRPARASRRTLRPSGPHGPGVAFRHPRSAISVPGHTLASRSAPHRSLAIAP
jgi:hypothetical protein